MNLPTILFWGLVMVTAAVSLRWGAMIGLIVFVLALLLGAVAISRLSPDKGTATVQGFRRPRSSMPRAAPTSRPPLANPEGAFAAAPCDVTFGASVATSGLTRETNRSR